MKTFMPFLFLSLFTLSLSSAAEVSDFEGDYLYRHSLYMSTEQSTVHGVEDVVKIQKDGDKQANILVETYTTNFQSCQLIGKAQLKNDELVFKSQVDKNLNRGKAVTCQLKIRLTKSKDGKKAVQIDDLNENCKLQYCGMQALLGGTYTLRSEMDVQVQDKN